jgi:phage host-nuclease inhibitor protein Gam
VDTKVDTKAKKPKHAKLPVPQDMQSAAQCERDLGKALTNIAERRLMLDQEIKKLLDKHSPAIEFYTSNALRYAKALHEYAAKNRRALTDQDKNKTVELMGAGTVRWYDTPPAISLSKETTVDELVGELEALGLARFVRIVKELDKEALLREPEVADSIKGISVAKDEKFVIQPRDSDSRLERKASTKRWKLVFKNETSPAT